MIKYFSIKMGFCAQANSRKVDLPVLLRKKPEIKSGITNEIPIKSKHEIKAKEMKKIKLFGILLLIALCAACVFTGCGKSDYKGIKVTYMLCGGTFLNGEEKVELYYKFPEGVERRIRALPVNDDSQDEVERLGYVLSGWYTDENYENEWDFDYDTVGDEGVTLYAKWEREVEYLYSVGYENEQGEFVSVYATDASRYLTFEDSLDKLVKGADSREGYTLITSSLRLDENDKNAYFDKKGLIKESDADVLIKVYADYIEGNYLLLYNASDFNKLSDAEYKGKGKTLLLMNDVDLNGASLNAGFRNAFAAENGDAPNFYGIHSYDPENKGVVYAIKNFNVTCEKVGQIRESITASVFGEIAGGEDNKVKINNVRFENAVVNVDVGNEMIASVYVSAFADTIRNAEISNVTITSKVIVSRNRKNYFYKAEKAFARELENVTTENCNFAEPEVATKGGDKVDLIDPTAE